MGDSLLYDTYLQKREYREIKNFQNTKSNLWITPPILELSAVQHLAKRYFNPRTKQKRMIFKLGTGVGKTLTSLEVALPFIKIFNVINQKLGRDYYVHIVGFTKGVYKSEFLKFPELGIITYDELHNLNMLKEMSLTSSAAIRDKIRDEYKKLKIKIVRRITDTATGGMYSFDGYKELYNNLFVGKLPDDINETNIYEEYRKKRFTVNKLLLDKFKNSLVIADEVQLAYNSEDTNNYGLAIQFLMDYYGNDIFAVFLSATFINNDKREIVSIANLVRDPGTPHFKSEDFFNASDKGKHYDASRLKPIYEQLKGKVIFLEESGSDYPKLIFEGKPYPIGNMIASKGIKYLTFDQAKMSPLHEQTFRLDSLYEETTNNFIILDMVFPNPEFTYDEHMAFHPDKQIAEQSRKKIENGKGPNRLAQVKGLYNNETCVSLIRNASQEWRNKIGIRVEESRDTPYFTGSFLRYENLRLYSSKYCLLLDLVYRILKSNPRGKIIIFHPFVRGSGIINIGQIFSENGIVDDTAIPNMQSYSAEEFITQEEWIKKYPGQEFRPARHFVVDFSVTETQKGELVDRWNAETNKYGVHLKIIIGAGKIKQSIDFKDTQYLIIAERPNTMSDFIQIKGRNVRKKSLSRLPPDMQTAHLHTLLSIGNDPKRDALEPRKYMKKIAEFDNIRAIEYNINKEAINNYMITEFKPIDQLGALPFKTEAKIPNKVSSETYFIGEYYRDMMSEINKQIKRAFISIPVWTYETLRDFVNANSSSLDTHDRLVVDPSTGQSLTPAERSSEQCSIFNIVLRKMIYNKDTFIENKNVFIFDEENSIINQRYVNGKIEECPNKVIVEFGDYLILGIVSDNAEVVVDQDMFFNDEVSKNINYNIKLKNDELIEATAIEQLLKSIKDYSARRLETFSYVFLFSWPERAHYIFIRDYLTNKNSKIPNVLINMYKKLQILNGLPLKNGSWYDEQYDRFTLNNGEFVRSGKPTEIRHDNKPLIGIIADGSFKVRDSRNDGTGDNRNTGRGVSCLNIVKSNINEYLKLLDIDIGSETHTKAICNIMLKSFINKEIESRAKGEGIRYIKLFNEP